MRYLILFLFLFYSSAALSDSYLKSWIPVDCCVTNDCCFEVPEKTIKEHTNGEAEYLPTGDRKKPMFSPDGKYYRCACDFNTEINHWVLSENANTRCLFIPNRGY